MMLVLVLAILGFFALVIFFGLYFPRIASIGCGIYFFFTLGIAAVLEQYIGEYHMLTAVILVFIFFFLLLAALLLDFKRIQANPFKKD